MSAAAAAGTALDSEVKSPGTHSLPQRNQRAMCWNPLGKLGGMSEPKPENTLDYLYTPITRLQAEITRSV